MKAIFLISIVSVMTLSNPAHARTQDEDVATGAEIGCAAGAVGAVGIASLPEFKRSVGGYAFMAGVGCIVGGVAGGAVGASGPADAYNSPSTTDLNKNDSDEAKQQNNE
ncbi:MAG: hypothetical protein ACXWQO_03330 [Bdellovibrionota bacterium]